MLRKHDVLVAEFQNLIHFVNSRTTCLIKLWIDIFKLIQRFVLRRSQPRWPRPALDYTRRSADVVRVYVCWPSRDLRDRTSSSVFTPSSYDRRHLLRKVGQLRRVSTGLLNEIMPLKTSTVLRCAVSKDALPSRPFRSLLCGDSSSVNGHKLMFILENSACLDPSRFMVVDWGFRREGLNNASIPKFYPSVAYLRCGRHLAVG